MGNYSFENRQSAPSGAGFFFAGMGMMCASHCHQCLRILAAVVSSPGRALRKNLGQSLVNISSIH